MRLLNTHTLNFEESFKVPEGNYAILSHQWVTRDDGAIDEEVSYEGYLEGSQKNRAGYEKIIDFCKVAREDGYRFAWIDTCCIDKRSSAELSEAINSMYKWYQQAGRCYVFLYDKEKSEWTQSTWWIRGWTLQELIAPHDLVFYDRSWSKIGSKSYKKIADQAADTAKLPLDLILSGDLRPYSIGVKMSWASGRSTTREEDEAYCLLGLLEVNMPLLYGEGRAAFKRLQRIVFEESGGDETIFAFLRSNIADGLRQGDESLFAMSPKQFRTNATEHGNIGIMRPWRLKPPKFTVWGLKIVSSAKRIRIYKPRREPSEYYVVRLACGWYDKSQRVGEPPRFPCFLVLTPYEPTQPQVLACTRVLLPSLDIDPVDQIRIMEGFVKRLDEEEVNDLTFYIVLYD